MTSLNPSHNPLSSSAQAVHQPDSSSGKHASSTASYPDTLPTRSGSESDDSDLGVDAHSRAERRGRREGRQRIQRGMVPVPDLRFEQSYLLSIRPFLKPRPSPAQVADRGEVSEKPESGSLVVSTESDEVFHWGREVDVDWRAAAWVTIRDQLLSPLGQGALWGVFGIFLASSSSALRSALYPASHVRKGRITGGPGGSISQAGGGKAVGSTEEGGWWRKFVGSWAGAVETNAAL